jgi:Protein of unknown function (DUF1778)
MYISDCDNSSLAQSPFLRPTMRPVTKGELSHGCRRRFGRCTLCGGLLEMTDRDRDRFLAALDRPPKPLPELERDALLRACATGEEG